MKILHYALGFPPYRSGGLTKFCVDLMIQQVKEGNIVAMLWPGQMRVINKSVSIRIHGNVKIKKQEILNFEVINPLPVSFDEGITDINAYTMNGGAEAYKELLDKFQPDVIHIHTLMGLHKSFLEIAKRKKIRLVFTAHDFFPICPKVTMFRNGALCDTAQTCENCGACNTTALSLNKIKILQSPVYRRMKDSSIVKKIRKYHRDRYLSELTTRNSTNTVEMANQYIKLRNYYYSLLKLMDTIHYNSSVTKKVYESFFDFPNNCIVSISHADIRDNRKIKNYSNDNLRIRYLGPQSYAKGYFLLRAALDKVWNIQRKFCLDVHFEPMESAEYIKVHERYSYNELDKLFDETDVLVAPSIWYETFGYTVLEALSYGVPVIISGNVGAKDILPKGAGIVIDNMDEKKLSTVLQNITLRQLSEMNQIIVKQGNIIQIEDMSRKIETNCYGWI